MNGDQRIAKAEGAMDDQHRLPLTVTETAKAIRLQLKAWGIKPMSVICSRFAGGTSISIYIPRATWQQLPVTFWTRLELTFKYGWFDGMTDSYHYYGPEHCIVYEGQERRPGAKYVNVMPTA